MGIGPASAMAQYVDVTANAAARVNAPHASAHACAPAGASGTTLECGMGIESTLLHSPFTKSNSAFAEGF